MFPASASSGAVTIAFPDVCKTPTPSGPVPIPYPTTATKALELQKARGPGSGGPARKTAAPSLPGSGALTSALGGLGGLRTGPTPRPGSPDPRVQVESAQLKGRLGTLHQRLSNLTSEDPDEWQQLLQDYAVAAAALYVTLHG